MESLRARLFESRLTLIYDYNLTEDFISLVENVFKDSFTLMVEKTPCQNEGTKIFWKNLY